jgi:RHS repeat-associated protein
VVALYGGLLKTPPYLIEVKPVVKSGGIVVATGSQPIGMAVKYSLKMDFRTPAGTESIANTVFAGNTMAIGLGGRKVTATEAEESHAAEILSARALSYLERWNQADEELAALLRVVPVRPTVSACFVMSDIQVQYAGGDPLYPLSLAWKGIAIDADLRSTAPVGLESRESERAFLLLSGLEGSILENRIFEDDLNIASVSTAKALQLAHEQSIEVLDLTQANVDAVLPGLPLDEGVKAEIREAVAKGFLARVPAADVSYLAWSGVGYLLLDEETGQAAYQLQGGHSGGVTAPATVDIPKDIVDALEAQNETPAPVGSEVAHVMKFPLGDFQEGTVNKPLPLPLRVLVTNVEGHPVPNAQVTYTVIGGGGVFKDVTGALLPELTVFSNARGEASAVLVLGKKTDLIPRYTVSPDGSDEAPTQVGMNLVTVHAGTGALPEPFISFGFPDKRCDPTKCLADLTLPEYQQWWGWANLRVAGRITVHTADQYGNPLSNIPIKYSYRPSPVLALDQIHKDFGPTWGPNRDATDSPGTVLKPKDFETCRAKDPDPQQGECEGEAPALTIPTHSLGDASVYAFLGGSSNSYYYFDIEGPLGEKGWVRYGSGGMVCNPWPSCQAKWAFPATPIVNYQTRLFLSNGRGDIVEAYPLGGDADAAFHASVLWEKNRVETREIGGVTRYFALGTNEWVREPLNTSLIELTPSTEGTRVQPPIAASDAKGGYHATMTMSQTTPQLNTLRFQSKHFPPDVVYAAGTPFPPIGGSFYGEVVAAYVDATNMVALRVPNPDRPLIGSGDFSLWGIAPEVAGFDPTRLIVDQNRTLEKEAVAFERIRPDGYEALLAPDQVEFEILKKDPTTGAEVAVHAANGNDGKGLLIPRGLSLKDGVFTGRLSVFGVRPKDPIASPEVPIPACLLVDLKTPIVTLSLVRDPVNDRTCGEPAKLKFSLCLDSRVTILVDDRPLVAAVDGAGQNVPITDMPLAARDHEIEIPAALLGQALDATARFEVRAFSVADDTIRDVARGQILNSLQNRSALPVGHTFVKGVDVLDGHVVQQHTDVKVQGRHLGLEVSRTYSSAGHSPEGVMGAGWAWNYAASLTQLECGLVSVTTADGSSQVFQSNGDQFTPQKGYHTRLVKNGDLSYDFFDKSNTRHHFSAPDDPQKPDTKRRLDYIEEPHGDRIVPTYDENKQLIRVEEVQAGAGPQRSLEISYARAGEFDRVSKITVPDLAIEVDYGYDGVGNLTSAARKAANLPGPGPAAGQSTSYSYSSGNLKDPHQMLSATGPNGDRTEYVYFAKDDLFPGESSGLLVEDKEEFAKVVREFPTAAALETRFQYDYREALTARRFKTMVRDPRSNDTLYVLNSNGSPLEIHEPLGKTAIMEWAADDIFKTKETDANGRVTTYGHDSKGNLTLESIQAAGLGAVNTRYEYDLTFGKLTLKQDAEGRTTRYVIDPTNGDLLSMTDGAGNTTQYHYDGYGRMTSLTDPRGHDTGYGDFDSYANARTVTDALNNVTTREYDARGRLTHETDTVGRETERTFDGLDRVVQQRRLAKDAGSADEVTSTTYYADGQVQSVTNPLGGTTTHILDGANREKQTVTPSGTITRELDANGNAEFETDRRGVRRHNVFDELNRLASSEILSGPAAGPIGIVATFKYDLVGNKLSDTDIAGLTTGYEYDGLYRVSKKLLAEPGLSEQYGYDLVGNKTSSTDANNHTTLFSYDGLNRLVRTQDAEGHVSTAAYDDPEGSHVNKSQDHDETRGLRTLYAYDALNRETSHEVHLEGPGSSGEVYRTTKQYNDSAHTVTVTDPRGTQSEVKLNGLDREFEMAIDPSGLNLRMATSYDGAGDKVLYRDARGFDTHWGYDTSGRLTSIAYPDGSSEGHSYDGEGATTSETYRRGVTKAITRDNLARVVHEEIPGTLSGLGWTHDLSYLDTNPPARIDLDARSKSTRVDLDRLYRVTKTTDPYGKTTRTVWDGVNKREETDKRGNTWKYEYDGINRLTRTTDPDPFSSQTAETTYDDASNRHVEKDRRGIQKVTQLDSLGRIRSVTRAGTRLELNSYDENSNKVRAVDAENKTTAFEYDKANHLFRRVDGASSPDEAVTTFKPDANGNPEEELDPRTAALGDTFSMKRTFDPVNRVLTVTDGENHTTSYTYDGEGKRTSLTEPLGQATSYTYDELGKLTTVAQPGAITTHVYDANRNRIRQIDANGHAVEMAYDDVNRLVSMTQDPGGLSLVTQHQYDDNGNETLLTDPKAQTVTSTYDELNRLKTKAYAFAQGDPYRPWRYTTGVVYSYDPNNNLAQAEESVASGVDPPGLGSLTTTKSYDDLDRLASETTTLSEGGQRTVGYTYFANGTRKTVTDPDSLVTAYTYDGQNRLATATTTAGDTTYTYWPDDLLKTITYPNGVSATYGYDKADRLTSLANAHGASVLSSYGYSYDNNGNRLTQDETNGGLTEHTAYTYDDLDRLKTITYPVDTAFPAGRNVTYEYDLVGNRTRETETTGTGDPIADKQGHFDNANRLTELTDLRDGSQTTTFGWDPNGNQTSKTVAGVTTDYKYDIRDKLVEVDQGASILGRSQYDCEGRRSKKVGDGAVTQYVYDQTSTLVEYDETGSRVAKYDYGSDRLISLFRRDEPRRFYSFDGLRSVTNLTDDGGSAVAIYHLDAWGNYRFQTELNASNNRFGFTGYLWDQAPGLYFAKARFFDPQIGRFLTQDSLLGSVDSPPSLHRYFYANDNPTRFVDPTGHTVWDLVGGAGAAGEWLSRRNINLAGTHAGSGWGKALNFGVNAWKEAIAQTAQLPQRARSGLATLLTPGERTGGGTEGLARINQAAALTRAAGSDSMFEKITLTGAAYLSQPAVALEEGVLQPILDVKDQSERVGVHTYQAYAAAKNGDMVSAAIHGLEAAKEGSAAFGTLGGLAAGGKGLVEASQPAQGLTTLGRIEPPRPPTGSAESRFETVGQASSGAIAAADVGQAILDNPVSSRSLSQLQEAGRSVELNYGEPPAGIRGRTGLVDDRIKLYMSAMNSAEEAASTLSHEAAHVRYAERGSKIPFASQLDEFRAAKREFLFSEGRRPTLNERFDIWQTVHDLYVDKPLGGQVPFGLFIRNVF